VNIVNDADRKCGQPTETDADSCQHTKQQQGCLDAHQLTWSTLAQLCQSVWMHGLLCRKTFVHCEIYWY